MNSISFDDSNLKELDKRLNMVNKNNSKLLKLIFIIYFRIQKEIFLKILIMK